MPNPGDPDKQSTSALPDYRRDPSHLTHAHRHERAPSAGKPDADRDSTSVTTKRRDSHTARAADLRLCHTVALTRPVYVPKLERDAAVKPARPHR
jgi:hypothetical protein